MCNVGPWFLTLRCWMFLLCFFAEYRIWEEEIEKWQNPILKNEKLPEWYNLSSIFLSELMCSTSSVKNFGSKHLNLPKKNKILTRIFGVSWCLQVQVHTF